MTEPRVGRADNNDDKAKAAETAGAKRRVNWSRVLVYGVLPGLALVLAMAAGFLKWQDSSIRDADIARIESVAVAKETTIALLSFRPDTIEQDVRVAQDRLTGGFRETYAQVARDVLIPNTKEKRVSAVARIPVAAAVSASENHAVVLLFVNQTVTVGTSTPTDATSSVRVTLDKIGGRWLISGFDQF
jgi:Mce-associated membrane protein